MTALEIADWRRRVFALYAEVRAADDPAAAHELWRRGRDELIGKHPASPLPAGQRSGFTGLPVTGYRPGWRFEVALEDAEPQRIEVQTGTDGVVPFELLGLADLPGVGRLDVWRLASYAGGIFVPVKDGLAGKPGGTYGGGRYLLDTVKGADLGGDPARGVLVLDLNFAYNPSCAYDPAWACPLARPGNTVATDIPVGELY